MIRLWPPTQIKGPVGKTQKAPARYLPQLPPPHPALSPVLPHRPPPKILPSIANINGAGTASMFITSPVYPWGSKGHDIVAAIAETYRRWRVVKFPSASLHDQGRVKTVGPINASALERVSSESIESDRALGLSGPSP